MNSLSQELNVIGDVDLDPTTKELVREFAANFQ